MNILDLLTGIRDAMGFHLNDETTIVKLVADKRCIGYDDIGYIEVYVRGRVYQFIMDTGDLNDLRKVYNHVVSHILFKFGFDPDLLQTNYPT